MDLEHFLRRAELLMDRVELLLPPSSHKLDWHSSTAFVWRRRSGRGYLQAVRHIAGTPLSSLRQIGTQVQKIEQNTRQFVAGRPANNVLLTGARGTGKSSLIRACLTQYADHGLRLIEVDKNDLSDMAEIVDLIAARPEKFIIFCDDLSFEQGDPAYKALKVALDGSIVAQSSNVLIYATSNRRHLMPEQQRDNSATRHDEHGDLHPGETVEEKISLSDRFGLWLSFYPFEQDAYLDIAMYWLHELGCPPSLLDEARRQALQWALQRGSRSGRVANQFARAFVGEHVG